jgi:hypothetical protein
MNAINNDEKYMMISISSLIGDSDQIDIDYDDISEATEENDLNYISSIVDLMFDTNILSVLCYEDGIYG